ncbi:MAG: nucleoside 2-deoxyribosyltransferase [Candidatus Micrarchaeales archaeon]|jgi:nucleoside 2-deoxyribosyltransferase
MEKSKNHVTKEEMTKVFIISPVRNMTDEEQSITTNYIAGLKQANVDVYYPPVNTDQSDPRGLRICEQNREGIRGSQKVIIYWNRRSEGSAFDYGMAFALRKPIQLMNKTDSQEEKAKDCFERMLLNSDLSYPLSRVAERSYAMSRKHISIISSDPATLGEKGSIIRGYTEGLRLKGIIVNWPEDMPPIEDKTGCNTCLRDLEEMSQSNEVHIFWNGNSKRSLFNLGMAFALGKPIALINRADVEAMADKHPGKCFEKVLLDLDSRKSSETLAEKLGEKRSE